MERMNTVVVRNLLQGQGERREGVRRDTYMMDVNKEGNCYNCGKFDYMARYYRSCGIVGQRRKIEYRNNINHRGNLKEKVWFTPGWKSTKWTWRCIDLWNDLGFSLCAVLSVCYIVTTLDDREKSKMEVSADLMCCC